MRNKGTIITTPNTFSITHYGNRVTAKRPLNENWLGKRLVAKPETNSKTSQAACEDEVTPASEMPSAKTTTDRPPPEQPFQDLPNAVRRASPGC